MEEQSMAKKKKGFMTPERKKKLRVSKNNESKVWSEKAKL
jgi:hypothetical protein